MGISWKSHPFPRAIPHSSLCRSFLGPRDEFEKHESLLWCIPSVTWSNFFNVRIWAFFHTKSFWFYCSSVFTVKVPFLSLRLGSPSIVKHQELFFLTLHMHSLFHNLHFSTFCPTNTRFDPFLPLRRSYHYKFIGKNKSQFWIWMIPTKKIMNCQFSPMPDLIKLIY